MEMIAKKRVCLFVCRHTLFFFFFYMYVPRSACSKRESIPNRKTTCQWLAAHKDCQRLLHMNVRTYIHTGTPFRTMRARTHTPRKKKGENQKSGF